MIERNTASEALSRHEFDNELREWLDYSDSAVIGDAEKFGKKAWVWVKQLGWRYYLNADTTRDAVAEYIRLLDEAGGKLSWSVVPNERGVENKVAFGPTQRKIEGFYLYRKL